MELKMTFGCLSSAASVEKGWLPVFDRLFAGQNAGGF